MSEVEPDAPVTAGRMPALRNAQQDANSTKTFPATPREIRPKTAHAKQLIAIRMDPRLLAELRSLAAKQSKPYQTLIHELLRRAVEQCRMP